MTVTRERIIAEIQRVAEEIGRPPGKAAFTSATGIKESDWAGRHWARWSDALAEAGLDANSWQQAHPDEHIALAVIGEIRRLGRYPTANEMRLRRRADPTFPGTLTSGHIRRAATVELVMRFCASDPEAFADVIAILEPLAESASVDSEPAERSERIAGYVYMVKSGRHHKIGLSTDVQRRMLQLNTGMPEAGELVHVISTDDPAGIERYWHARFADKRVRPDAEWFDLSADDVRSFKRRKFM